MPSFREVREARLEAEVGTLHKQADLAIALVYPSPYVVGMSSLGYQTIYRLLNGLPGVAAERAFLPDDIAAARRARSPLLTYESARPVGDFPVIALSLAYELEIAGVVDCLDIAGVPALAEERTRTPGRWPLVVVGGPLTFSNPVPAAPFADVMLLGEAENLIGVLTQALDAEPAPVRRTALLEQLARLPGFYVPALHGARVPPIAAAEDADLPARSQIRTPNTTLADMFLIEPERGCHRGCTYCVMRRSTNGGMRLVDPERVVGLVPADAKRVGLVGAAVTDHPRLREILRTLVVDQGRQIGISSLRADRLDSEIVGLLRRGGYRTLTTASDGASERLRAAIERKTREKHLLRAAALCREHGLETLKIYMMLGLPGETEQDIDELARFSLELAEVAPRLAMGVAPFVAKRATPLDGAPFDGIAPLEGKLARLRSALRGRVEVRPTSPRWAWVEYRLAQGGLAAGRAAATATRAGGRFSDWKRALADVPEASVRNEPEPPAADLLRLRRSADVRSVA